jgi:type I restriction-modification system DNA methylase subunit
MASTIFKNIQEIVISHISHRYGGNHTYSIEILSALKYLLKGTYEKYRFQTLDTQLKDVLFQETLAKVNEKESRRKSAGVFYTDSDVTDFMVLNSFYHHIKPSSVAVSPSALIQQKFKGLSKESVRVVLQLSVFDPTCGAGAFLVSALAQKIELFKAGICNDIPLVNVVGTIIGNDIESTSTDITKLRLFFLVIDSFEYELDVVSIAKVISDRFYNVDMIDYKGSVFGNYDIIVGNPPYIEYGKYEGTIVNDYGNVYADVMKNVSTMLNPNGVLALVVPLSYISTARMGSIREYVHSQTGKQLLLNFADRPDCLFSGVHQKLTIVMAQKTRDIKGIYTSKYNHWYKTERETLFSNLTLEKIHVVDNRYWPKLGDSIGAAIYEKILSYRGENILSLNKGSNKGRLYINLRACFWMKVFSKDMKSNSYKEYQIDKTKLPFVYCLLNSSLFFLIWTILSEGWHITNKELSFIKIPNRIPKQKKWSTLFGKLENQLETTKEYVGTKQVDYEYKHKLCKDIIDEIDVELKSVYKLSALELNYIKKFNEKYRISDGA